MRAAARCSDIFPAGGGEYNHIKLPHLVEDYYALLTAECALWIKSVAADTCHYILGAYKAYVAARPAGGCVDIDEAILRRIFGILA